VRNANSLTWTDVTRRSGVRGVLALRTSVPRTPWWVAYLAPHLSDIDPLQALANASTAALLIVEVAGRRFAFAFGYGRHSLDPEAYEQDFGLKVVLNTVDADRLVSIDARTFDELTMHTRRDLSQGSSFAAFGLDISRDLVRAVTGPPRDEALGARASGSDALALLTRAQFEELPNLCERLLAAYQAQDYKERFGWIDHLRRVREPSLTERLNERLLEAIRTRQLTDMHLAPPEPMSWSQLSGFTYSTGRDDELDPDPRITSYLETIGPLEDVELVDLKRDRVVAVSAETDQPLETWSVFRCVVFETREGDVLYVLTAGQWYSVSASFADEVIDFAGQLPSLELDLPAASTGVREEDYNRDAAAGVGALCLDQELVVTPVGDRIEPCDLLTTRRQLVHVKKRGSSSTLSHLFSQGVVAGELLVREPAFRREARQTVADRDGNFALLLPDARPEPGTWEVGFVVITRSRRNTPLTLPFFSLVNLRSAVLRLQDLGYRVSVRQVEEA
jgi:uncharacterized protein (TIGR04141 family)